MNLFCEEVHKLEAEFKQCRKLLNAIGDENRQHLICVMMNMPIDGGPCIGDCRADASSGLPFLDMKKITRESLKKAEKPSIR